MAKRAKITLTLVLLAALAAATYSAAAPYLRRFTFNEDDALAKWGKMILNGPVEYRLMRDGNNGYVEAISENSCSALYYRLRFNLKDYALLSWRWRVLKFPDKSKATTDKERDDYAARVYVIFPYLSFSSSKFIEYVWDKDLPLGTVMTSPRSNNVKQIVARTGELKEGQWVNETRNVYDDYVLSFGKPPNLSVGAIAIMCNADNTKTEAESLFDEIVIANEAGIKRRVE